MGVAVAVALTAASCLLLERPYLGTRHDALARPANPRVGAPAAQEQTARMLLDVQLDAPPDRVRARLAALLDVLSRDAAVARCFLVEPLAAGGDVAARYREAMQLVAGTLRPEPPPSELDMEIRDQALIGGIATLIVRRLTAGGARRLPELLPDLTELALAPYVGRQEAKRLAA